MAHDADYLFALKLQAEFNAENDIASPPPIVPAKRKLISNEENLNATQNLVHPDWENIDPTPDVHSLFGAFDIKFFQGKLKCVELEWSKRMYQCAGICYLRTNHFGKSITIRLSEPLLKLRSRRNLIETLLHEMIHAYLFILNIREGNGGHGPNFVKIMKGINLVAGTNITVYHNFHDEVNLYKTHIWRCNGICQHRKPFYGWVKRVSNRAPGPNDNWWQRHHESCGGVFQKVSEPEPISKAKKAKTLIRNDSTPKITNWARPSRSSNTGAGGGTKMNGSSGSKTIVIRAPPKTQNIRTINDNETVTTTNYVPSSNVGGNLGNVVGFKDLNGSSAPAQPRPVFPLGSGIKLDAGTSNRDASDPTAVAERIRNVWAQKFNEPIATAVQPEIALDPLDESKANSNSDNNRNYVETQPTQKWEEVDDEIMVWEEKHPIIELCDDDSDSDDAEAEVKPIVQLEKTVFQPDAIKRELCDDLGEDDDVIELIDDEFDNAFNESIHILTDTSVIDELFGEDTLMADFNNINNVIMNDPENRGNPNREIITCPICQDRMQRDELSPHLEGCTGITVKIEVKHKSRAGGKAVPLQLPFYKNHAHKAPSSGTTRTDKEFLRNAGYTSEQIDRVLKESAEAKDYNDRIMNEMAVEERNRRVARTAAVAVPINNIVPTATTTANTTVDATVPAEGVSCPVCNQAVDASEINQHLDECLAKQYAD